MPSGRWELTEDADAKSISSCKPIPNEEVIYVAFKDENLSVLGQSELVRSLTRRAN